MTRVTVKLNFHPAVVVKARVIPCLVESITPIFIMTIGACLSINREGIQTKEVVRECLKIRDDSQVERVVPCNVQHNSAFIVDSWGLDDVWDIKCNDMGSWTNEGRKPMGTMADKYDTYRQSYKPGDLPSLKKSLIYLLNAKGIRTDICMLNMYLPKGKAN